MENPNDKLQTRTSNLPAVPDYIKKGDTRGTENIGRDDVKPPALRLAQSSSPETKRSEPDRFIEGLAEGQFFNSITKQNYGEGPLQLVVINQLGHRHVLFDKDGKVVERNIPDNDPRTQWDGNNKPTVTKFYDYLVFLLGEDEPRMMTMSLKSTQLKKAVTLNTQLKESRLPSFAHLLEANPVPERGNGKSWMGWRFTFTGYAPADVYHAADKVYGEFFGVAGQKQSIVVDDEIVDDATGTGEMKSAGSGSTDDDIPF